MYSMKNVFLVLAVLVSLIVLTGCQTDFTESCFADAEAGAGSNGGAEGTEAAGEGSGAGSGSAKASSGCTRTPDQD